MEPTKTSSALRILLVENNEYDGLAFRRAFQNSEVTCEITACARAEDALEMLGADASLFDLVVIDHGLQGMSGLDLCKELLDKETPLPLVILTGRGSEQLAVEALRAGVDDYIIKDPDRGYVELLPVVLSEVLRKHSDHLARKRAEEVLRKARNELEQSVGDRTAELARTSEQLKLELSERKRVEEALRETVRRLEVAYEQSIVYARELNEEIYEHKRAEEALRESEEKYRTLVKSSLTGIYIVQDGKIVFANDRFAQIYGYSQDELMGIESLRLVHPDDRAFVKEVAAKRLRGEEAPSEYEARGLTKDGTTIWVARRNTQIDYRGRGAILGNVVNITERKRAVEALHEKSEALKAHARKLQEVTTALRVLLRQREQDKTEIEEKIVSNVKQLVLPYVEALKNTRLTANQRSYASIIESNLNEIVSPFLRKLSSEYLDLTSKEIQIADLIKDGKTTKEIAELLYVSTAAVDFHRRNIRAKLGLKNKSVSLKSYLLSLD